MNFDRKADADLETLFFSLSDMSPDERRGRLAELTTKHPRRAGIVGLLRRLFVKAGDADRARKEIKAGDEA